VLFVPFVAKSGPKGESNDMTNDITEDGNLLRTRLDRIGDENAIEP
jgi:hypothetical protein